MATDSDTWDPAQYGRFRDERAQPFFDLLALITPTPGGRAIDLGCGPGELTHLLHNYLDAESTLGLDASPAMLARSDAYAGDGVTFAHGDIATFEPEKPFDVVFSNAALQWVPDHERLFARLATMVAPGGQLAVQIPSNQDHPSQSVAREVAAREPFASALAAGSGHTPTREPEWFADLLYRLGFGEQHVRLQVYTHLLDGPEAVIEWMRGSLLTDYERRLPAEVFPAFEAAYGERLLDQLPAERPYQFTFRRLLLWARASQPEAV